jgi:dTDP-4-dehydrorhamnose 3,5-epimerase-like enzyme
MNADEPKIIGGGKAVDDRGSISFVNEFDFAGVKRFYQVQNHQSGFIRAWHGHRNEGKYVYVAAGAALVGIVNLETEKISKFVLSADVPKILWIPPNHANGFMNLRDDTIIIFYSTATLDESANDDIRFPYDKWDIWQKDYR